MAKGKKIMGPLDIPEIENKLSSPVRFKLREKITGRTQSGRLLGSCSFGKPLRFPGVFESYSFFFFKFQETDIIKFYKNAYETTAVKFNIEGLTVFTDHMKDHNIEIVIKPSKDGTTLNAKLCLVGRRSGYIIQTIRFELLNTLEYNLLKRQYRKFDEFDKRLGRKNDRGK